MTNLNNNNVRITFLCLKEKSKFMKKESKYKIYDANDPILIADTPGHEKEVYDGPFYRFKKNGLIHRDNDLPAMIDPGVILWWFQNGALHRENGPAISFFDSPEDNLYFLNGVGMCTTCTKGLDNLEFGKKIVENPQDMTIEELNNIENLEIKRLSIERFGLEQYITRSNCKIIDKGTNDIEGTVESIFATNDLRYFCGACKSTGRMYFILIPNEVATCKEARLFLASKNEERCVGAS